MGRSIGVPVLGAVMLMASAVGSNLAAQTTFTDVAASAGFNNTNSGWAHAWADYNRDGFLDVITIPHYQALVLGATTQLWRNNKDGTFTDVSAQAGIVGSTGDTHGVVWGDFDGDGALDIFISREVTQTDPTKVNELWRNNRNGTFTNVASAAGVTGDTNRPGRGVGAIDIDLDGDLDIFETVTFRGPTDLGNLLFRNDGALTFTDIAAQAGLVEAGIPNRMAAWADYDSDGLMDVLIVSPCRLLRNLGDGTFVDVTAQAGISVVAARNCYNAAWGDYDNDGHPDFYVNKILDGSGLLYRNNGDGTFADVTLASGLVNVPIRRAVGLAWGDYDNDGDLDLYVVNAINASEPNRLFRNNGDGTFTDVTAEAGVGAQVEGAGSDADFIDYDNDGDLDLFVLNGDGNTVVAPFVLYRNNGTGANHWLKVTPQGRPGQSNLGAVGTKVWLSAGGVQQFRQYTGQHYMSQDAIPVHFGLGQASVVDSLTIQWPSGLLRTFRFVAPNRHITVREPLAP